MVKGAPSPGIRTVRQRMEDHLLGCDGVFALGGVELFGFFLSKLRTLHFDIFSLSTDKLIFDLVAELGLGVTPA